MLRGVHRQIIEINEPQSTYFEKVLLFVKPQCPGISEYQLRQEARRVVQHLGGQPPAGRLRKARQKRRFWQRVGLCAAGILLVGLVIFIICS